MAAEQMASVGHHLSHASQRVSLTVRDERARYFRRTVVSPPSLPRLSRHRSVTVTQPLPPRGHQRDRRL